MTKVKALITTFVVVALGFITSPVLACGGESCSASCNKKGNASAEKQLDTLKPADGQSMKALKIKGTKCGKCARRIESVLSKVEGVDKVAVSHKRKQAKVVFEEGAAVSVDTLKAAVSEAGHKPGQFKAEKLDKS